MRADRSFPILLLGLLQASASSAAPPWSPREERAFPGRTRSEARLRSLDGVARIQVVSGLRLEDENGPWLLVRLQVRNARQESLELRPEHLQVRTPDRRWLPATGLSLDPPLSGAPFRPAFAAVAPVSIPRDQEASVFAGYRVGFPLEAVDLCLVSQGEPFFLVHPPRAPLDELTEDAIRFAEDGQYPLARGLLREAVRDRADRRSELARTLERRAGDLRRSDRPVSEDRVLRLSLPYASNPAAVHARLAELQKRLARRDESDQGRPPERTWAYHRRRAERLAVERDSEPVPTSPSPLR